jgi:hypothetical protein
VQDELEKQTGLVPYKALVECFCKSMLAVECVSFSSPSFTFTLLDTVSHFVSCSRVLPLQFVSSDDTGGVFQPCDEPR